MCGENCIHSTVLYMEVERREDTAAWQSDLFGVVVDSLPETSTTIAESVNTYSDEQKGMKVYPG